MKDTTLLIVGDIIGMRMWLDEAHAYRQGGRAVYTATVSGEVIGLDLFGRREVRTATGTAEGESHNGAMILAYATCMRAFIAVDPLPEAFANDIHKLEEQAQ